MGLPRKASRDLPIRVAIIGAFSLLVAACGIQTAEITTESAAVPAPVAVPDGAAPEAGGQSGHEYGTSIDDWTVVAAESASLQGGSATADDASGEAQSAAPTIEWDDLIPPGFSGDEISKRYEEQLDGVTPGSFEANALYNKMMEEYDPEAVNPGLNGQRIRLAGFASPLSYEDDLVTEFLLVPTFGACIHVPAPPPNQTVMVTLDKDDALSTYDTWGPIWVEGTIIVDATTTDLASASYTIADATSGVYDDF